MTVINNPQVAVIVLNFNGLKETQDCLASLRRVNQNSFNLKIIVVDNASQDGSVEALSNLKDIELIQSQKNLGFAGGMNLGIKFALNQRCDFVIIMNNDTYVDPDFITNMLKSTGEADIISPKIYFAPGFEFHKQRYKKSDLGKIIWYAGGEIDWQNIVGKHLGVDELDRGQFKKTFISLATGCCMMVSSSTFNKIGYLDEKYFMYLEDMDFCHRAQKAGLKILFEPEAFIWHKNASSAGGSGSKLQDYYITRNRLYFAFKYAKFKTKIALLVHVFRNFNNPIRKKALLDFLTFHYGHQTF